jgi:hypothetical protein
MRRPVMMTEPENEPKPDEDVKTPDKTGPYRTMRVGEAPGEDLGYDPEQIPTEPIVTEEDD